MLAEARRAAGLTHEQISERTRVRVPIVVAIERDDFSTCGGDFYARGHIRTLARAVGVDPEPLVAAYGARHADAIAPQPRQIFEAERIQPERRQASWTGAMVAAIVVVLAFVTVNLFGGDGGERQAADDLPASSDSASAEPGGGTDSSTAPTPSPSASPSAVAVVPADRVTVTMTATGRSWVSVTSGEGEDLLTTILEDGQEETFEDPEELRLVIGNAGAVSLNVNGEDLGEAGDPGEVVRLTYTPGEPQAG
ncbi:cytoskeletal protein RodZ [Allostreptomyces psammosilenae]|uniref:Cytoskeletal protein RodZ n=1 Tax=Allostreptomyces psammosilenae TaxID=1892865 RepID=A0A852ZWM8_9ACTN|nr:RodZ domain-containing protein [Allostreptomyces psammosilenae]NYI03061.1 cytoskeletal protein RodZ [Allostreptomyces psammosilenae]